MDSPIFVPDGRKWIKETGGLYHGKRITQKK